MLPFRAAINLKDFFKTRKSVNPLGWLILDRFYTSRTQGNVDGTPCEPGGGQRHVTEGTNDSITVQNSELVVDKSGVLVVDDAWDTYLIADLDGSPLTNTQGLTTLFTLNYVSVTGQAKWNTGFLADGFDPATADDTIGFYIFRPVINVPRPGGTTVFSGYDDTEFKGVVVCRPTGYYFLGYGGGVSSSPALLWVDDVGTTGDGNLKLFTSGLTATINYTLDDLRAVVLDSTDSTLYPIPALSDNFSDETVVTDYGSNGFNGTPNRVGLTGSEGIYSGNNSYTNIYSAGFNTAFDGSLGTVIYGAQVENTDFWSDATQRDILCLQADFNNRVLLFKNSTTDTISFQYKAGGTTNQVNKGSVSPSTLFTMGITWSDFTQNNRMRAFYNGTQEGVDQTPTGTFVGNLAAGNTVIGALFLGDTSSWAGSITDVVVGFGVEATPAQMSTIDGHIQAGTLTTVILDSIFGAGNYAWYAHDDQYTTDGNAHVEGPQGNGLDWSGPYYNDGNKAYIVPQTGPELLVNGDFSAWTADDPDGWTVIGEVGVDPEVTERASNQGHAGGGVGACNLYSSATNSFPKINQTILTSGNIYRYKVSVTNYVSGVFAAGASQPPWRGIGGVGDDSFSIRAVTPTCSIFCFTAPGDCTFNEISVKNLPFSSLLRSIYANISFPYIVSNLTITNNTQSGLVINVDNIDNPQNCIHVWCDRMDNTIVARELIAGVWQADRLSVSDTYNAGAALAVRRIGDDIHVFYDDDEVGSFTTVVPDTGTLVALFATDEDSYFEDTVCWPTDGYDYSRYD